MNDMPTEELSKDFLHGAAAIAEYLFGDRKFQRKVFYIVEKGRLPVVRFKSHIFARKSALKKWIEEEEKRNSKGNRRDNTEDDDSDDDC